MLKYFIFVLLVSFSAYGVSFAEGVKKTLLFTLHKIYLGGYTATPAQGWIQVFNVNACSPNANIFITSAAQWSGDPNISSHLAPDAQWLTIVSPKGAIISKEELPLQLNDSQCAIGCIQSSQILPTFMHNKYLIEILQNYNGTSNTNVYILDTSASLTSANRWMSIGNGFPSGGINTCSAPGLGYNYLYMDDQLSSPGDIKIFSIKPK